MAVLTRFPSCTVPSIEPNTLLTLLVSCNLAGLVRVLLALPLSGIIPRSGSRIGLGAGPSVRKGVDGAEELFTLSGMMSMACTFAAFGTQPTPDLHQPSESCCAQSGRTSSLENYLS